MISACQSAEKSRLCSRGKALSSKMRIKTDSRSFNRVHIFELYFETFEEKQQSEPYYMEMGQHNVTEHTGTIDFAWYYLMITPIDQTQNEWRGIGFPKVCSSNLVIRPAIASEERRGFKGV